MYYSVYYKITYVKRYADLSFIRSSTYECKNTNRAEEPSPPPDCERNFTIPSDLREYVQYVGFVEGSEAEAFLAEILQRCADQVKFLVIDN